MVEIRMMETSVTNMIDGMETTVSLGVMQLPDGKSQYSVSVSSMDKFNNFTQIALETFHNACDAFGYYSLWSKAAEEKFRAKLTMNGGNNNG